MSPRSLALVFGFGYTGLAVLGMLPGVVREGWLFGVFPVNLVLATLHLALGMWGIAAFAGRAHAGIYARRIAFVFATLALMGMARGLDTVFGLMPLYGAVVWLHLASAALAGFVGWRPETGERRSLAGDRRRARRGASQERRRRHDDRRHGDEIATA